MAVHGTLTAFTPHEEDEAAAANYITIASYILFSCAQKCIVNLHY